MPSKKAGALTESFKSTALLEKNILVLEKENKALHETVSKLIDEVNRLSGLDTNGVITLKLTPAQEIVEIQIERLRTMSRERILSLEESKMLDLYIKNKRLMDDANSIPADYERVPEGITDEDLLEIAGHVEKEEKTIKKTNKRGKSKASN